MLIVHCYSCGALLSKPGHNDEKNRRYCDRNRRRYLDTQGRFMYSTLPHAYCIYFFETTLSQFVCALFIATAATSVLVSAKCVYNLWRMWYAQVKSLLCIFDLIMTILNIYIIKTNQWLWHFSSSELSSYISILRDKNCSIFLRNYFVCNYPYFFFS